MSDCVFSIICEGGYCNCDAYLSMNSEEGYALEHELEEKTNEAMKPVREWLETKMHGEAVTDHA